MSARKNAYQGLGSILARLSFCTSFQSTSGNELTKEEQDALCYALTASISTLIQAGQIFEFDQDEMEGCAAEFALELTQFVAGRRIERERVRRMMELYSDVQAPGFEPASKADATWADAGVRVQRQEESNIVDLFSKGRP